MSLISRNLAYLLIWKLKFVGLIFEMIEMKQFLLCQMRKLEKVF